MYIYHFYLFFTVTFTFQLNSYEVLPSVILLLDKPWSQVGRYRPFFPPGTCLQFLLRIGFSIPTARRFSSNVANYRMLLTHALASSDKNQFFTQCKKTSLRVVCALGENWTREIYFISRHEDNLPSHRRRLLINHASLKKLAQILVVQPLSYTSRYYTTVHRICISRGWRIRKDTGGTADDVVG